MDKNQRIDEHAANVPDGQIEELLVLLDAFAADQSSEKWQAISSYIGQEAERSRDLADITQQIREATALSERLRSEVRRVLDKLRPLNVGTLGTDPLNPPTFPWTIPGWLPTGRLTILSGNGGLGKSRLALRLAAAMAAGYTDWLTGPATISRPDLDPSAGEDGVVTVVASWEDCRRGMTAEGCWGMKLKSNADWLLWNTALHRANCISGTWPLPARYGHLKGMVPGTLRRLGS